MSRSILGQTGLLLAGTVFAAGLALMQPQMTALAAGGTFLQSIAAEPGAWVNGHILLLAAAVLYAFAALGVHDTLSRHGKVIAAPAISALLIIGSVMLGANFTLDFVYAALAGGLDGDAAQTARNAMLDDPLVSVVFANVGPGIMLLGMAALAIYSLFSASLPRATGVLIILGWAVVLGLHGKFPYAEALGHFLVGGGFALIALIRKTPDA